MAEDMPARRLAVRDSRASFLTGDMGWVVAWGRGHGMMGTDDEGRQSGMVARWLDDG